MMSYGIARIDVLYCPLECHNCAFALERNWDGRCPAYLHAVGILDEGAPLTTTEGKNSEALRSRSWPCIRVSNTDDVTSVRRIRFAISTVHSDREIGRREHEKKVSENFFRSFDEGEI